MPETDTRPSPYSKSKDLQAEWNTFRKGLNLLLRPTELSKEEYAQGDNMMLVGSGVPTGRWGSASYFSINATGSIRGFGTFNNTASLTNELIGLTDQGYLAKKNGLVSTIITGQSYPSGSVVHAEQLGGYTYFVSKDRPLTQYNGGTLQVFATLTAPTGLTATNISGVTGSYTWSWKVTTLSPGGGETTPSSPILLPNLPQDLSATQVNISWSAPSAASISGFQIYRGLPADETFLAAVGASTTTYVDTGDPASEIHLAPITNTTGGVKSQFITKFTDRLLMVDNNDRTKLMISGRFPNQSKFSWADGGGFVYIDPDSGQDITGIAVQPGSNKIIVYKDFSHYSVELNTVEIGNFTILDPSYQPISTGVGCSNADTIQIVENDIFYFGRKGLYVTGYEPNFLSIIRTNEISARMRPYLANLNDDDYRTANSLYVDNKYLLSFPNKKDILVYDRERGSFVGIWRMPWGITKMLKYVDSSGTERWVFGTNMNNIVYTFEPKAGNDNGATISKTFRTNKESFGTWWILKILRLFHALLRNVTGSVNLNILTEDRTGNSVQVKTFTITGSSILGNSGWGTNLWGSQTWGSTTGSVVAGTDEFIRQAQLYKSARLVQIEVTTNQAGSNFELLSLKQTAASQGEWSLPASDRV